MTDAGKGRSTTPVYGRAPAAGVAVLILILAGLVVDANKADTDNFYSNIIRLDNVASKIHQSYVEEVSSEDLVDEAINGMVKILDPHTTYFQEKQYEELRIQTEGEFGGLGIQIAIRDKVLTVMTPISGTPAARANIQSGDQILSIDGKSTDGITIDEAVGKLRGQPGTDVTIVIRRRGEPKDMPFTITREVIKIKSVPFAGMLADGIGYVKLLQFSQESGAEIERAVRELVARKQLKGLVLDLRHNPGGLLPQAIEIAEKFLNRDNLIVSTRGRERSQNKESKATGSPTLPSDIPMVVMVDRASASASEIVAGALQDWDRGVVLGDTTFGKGSVQSILPLDATHKLKLTTAFYYTPSGRCINRPENDIRGRQDEDDESEEMEAGVAVSDTGRKADSTKSRRDTTTYRTNGGRIVFGGGGIIPDTVVEPERLSPVVVSLFGRDVFFRFANAEYPRLKARGVNVTAEYKPDETTMGNFRQFLDSMKFEFRTLAQVQLGDFKRRLGVVADTVDTAKQKMPDYARDFERKQLTDKERQAIRESVDKIEAVLSGASARSVKDENTEVRNYITESIMVRSLGQDHEALYRKRLAEDVQLQAAIGLLKDRKAYDALLKPRPKAK